VKTKSLSGLFIAPSVTDQLVNHGWVRYCWSVARHALGTFSLYVVGMYLSVSDGLVLATASNSSFWRRCQALRSKPMIIQRHESSTEHTYPI
jgi:formate-dependent nitrite reductase membrane component NrfD